MKRAIFKQFLNGEWIDLITIEINGDTVTDEEAHKELDEFSDLIRKCDGRMSITNQKDFVVFDPAMGPTTITVLDQ